MKQTLHKLFIAFAFCAILSSCEKEYESIEEIDAREVQSYIKGNNLSFQQYNNTGIYYNILSPGTGEDLKYTDKIFATFTVKSLDGQTNLSDENMNRFTSYLGYFSSSNQYPEAFATMVKEVLKKRGGKIRIIIPSHLAYGRSGNSGLGISGNTSLDCTITLYNVENKVDFEDVFVKKYFQSANIDINAFTRTNTGLYYQVLAQGTGDRPSTSSTVTVAYKGKLTDGTVFDEAASADLSLTNVIQGWQQALPLITEGGKLRIIIPPTLGYGSSQYGSIPPYSVLDFELELKEVK